MKRYLIFLLISLPFIFIKLTSLEIRLSDTSIYFYTGYKILQGEILYRDIFFTNFPLFAYISSLYFILSNGNIKIFYFTTTIEILTTAFFIFKISYKISGDIKAAYVSIIVFLYSFITLATSDHQSGVFAASMLAVISLYLLLNNKILISSIFLGLSLMTKAYFLPIALSFLLYLFLTDKKKAIKFIFYTPITPFIILAHTLSFSPNEFIKDVFNYSLTRAQGIDKINLLIFFITHEFIFVLCIIWNLLIFKKNILLSLITTFSLLFFIIYQDIYYLYLNFITSFLPISFSLMYSYFKKQNKQIFYAFLLIISFLILYNIYSYFSHFKNKQKILNFEKLIQVTKNNNSEILYGTNSIAPVIGYYSEKKLLNGIIDTNENIFRKGYLDSRLMTEDIINKNGLIIGTGAYYPEYGIDEKLISEIFDKEKIKEFCKEIYSSPILTEGIDNRINLLSCQKK